MAPSLFLVARTRKKKHTHTRLILVPARTGVKILLKYSTGKIKSNPLEPQFETSATMSQSLDGTKTAVTLPHCSESTKESIAGWSFSDQRDVAGVMAERRDVRQEKCTGKGASRRRFVLRIGEISYFLLISNTLGLSLIHI